VPSGFEVNGIYHGKHTECTKKGGVTVGVLTYSGATLEIYPEKIVLCNTMLKERAPPIRSFHLNTSSSAKGARMKAKYKEDMQYHYIVELVED